MTIPLSPRLFCLLVSNGEMGEGLLMLVSFPGTVNRGGLSLEA